MSCYFPLNDFSIFTCRLKRTFSWHAKEWTWWMLSNKFKNIWYIFCLTRNLLTLDLNCINAWCDSNRVKNLLFLHFNCFLFCLEEFDTNMNDIFLSRKYRQSFQVPIKHVLSRIIWAHFLYFHYLKLPHFHSVMSIIVLIVSVFFLMCLISSFISLKR